jgi:hypothetical protein
LSFGCALSGKGDDPGRDGYDKGDEEDWVSKDVAWLEVAQHGDEG